MKVSKALVGAGGEANWEKKGKPWILFTPTA